MSIPGPLEEILRLLGEAGMLRLHIDLRWVLKIRRMNRCLEDRSFFTLSDSGRHLSPSPSVTMHRIAPSFKEEIYSPIIKNRWKTNL